MANTQQLFAALHALYHQDGADIKDQANRFLEQWQTTTDAWSVSDAVLHDVNSSMEAQYFCAQTLRTKVQRDFEELPAQAINSLRDSLMTLLLKYSKGPPPVRTQLCLALVALTVHVPAECWGPPSGVALPDSLVNGGAVAWFALQLQAIDPDVALPCLLELLTVLPQEVNSMKYAVRPERRRQHALELKAATNAAISILSSCLKPPESATANAARLKPKVLEAFGCWLRLSEGTALGPEGNQLASHPLVLACLEGLRSTSELFHAAVDAVSELVWCSVDQATRMMDPGMMPLIQVLVQSVMGLRPRFAVATQRALDEVPDEDKLISVRRSQSISGDPHATDEFDDDEHTAKGMARLFAEVGEAYVHLISTAVQEVQPPVDALLEVATHPDHTLASMSFNFWHRLAQSISSGWGPKSMANGVGGSSMEVTLNPTPQGEVAAQEQARRRAFFTPTFERLVTIIRGKVKYPTACSTWGKEAFKDFRKQRYEIADSLEDCATVLGYARCLALLVEPLATLSAAQAAGQPFDWRTADAALFCVRSVAPHAYDMEPGQPLQLSQLLAALPTLPRAHPLLLNCTCFTIASYAGWLNSSLVAAQPQSAAQATALLGSLLQLSFSCVDVHEASSGACAAILDLCTYCGRHMSGCAQPLMQLYNRLQGAGAGYQLARSLNQSTIDVPVVLEEDVQRVMQAVCVALCKSLRQEELAAAAAELLRPVLAAVESIALQLPAAAQPAPPTTASAFSSTAISSQHPYLNPMLDRLAVLFAHFGDKCCVANMLGKCWPTLDTVFSRCVTDGRVMERACRTLRLAVKGSGEEGLRMLPSLLLALADRFRITRHSAFLYILSELIKIHGHDEGAVSSMAQVLTAMLVDACANLKSLAQVQEDPEMLDDAYLLASRALTYSPLLLLSPSSIPGQSTTTYPALTTLMDTAMFGVLIQHREACCSVLSFLMRLTNVTSSDPAPTVQEALRAVVLPRAPSLTRLLMAGLVGVLPAARLMDLSSLLGAMLRAWGQQALGWLTDTVALLPETVVSLQEKEAFINAAKVLAQLQQQGGEANPRDDRLFEGAVDDLSDVCRRSPRARQSAQLALLPPSFAAAIIL